ncbi:recombinase family protein [Sinanaerobacter chloroacetimidivorans]|uniref:Recombinase family protein n=1 Tax=Sinanaerobacter chloroacetimidivorans TaxID=2818044 RepID=A0A8J7W0K9_9FIRM|nr:recombinase family protein [Sinanaerobacter chloroacetimidivorans]MBR0598577.1 recombinase family protein [Sinanaerobacter chloroacetimidivorans]
MIRRIYRSYAEGLSYKAIAESLTEEGIRYIPEKPAWNKNMVARILQNQNYLGVGKYPLIVEEELCQAAKMVQKPYTHTESKDIKAIKPLLVCSVCGKPVRRRVKKNGEERWYCEEGLKHIGMTITDEILMESIEVLWRHLIGNLQFADVGDNAGEDNPISLETIRLKNEIDQMLKAEKIKEDELKAKILELASLRYASFDTPWHNNRELMRRLRQAPQGFNIKLILEIAAEIKVSYCEAEALILKNGKVIAKGVNGNERSES